MQKGCVTLPYNNDFLIDEDAFLGGTDTCVQFVLAKINSKGKCGWSEFSDTHLYRCQFSSAYGYYLWESTKKKPKCEQTYIDDLKAVSSTYGYSPEEIEEVFLYERYL